MQFRLLVGAAALMAAPVLALAGTTTFSFDARITSVDQPPDIPGGFPSFISAGALLHVDFSFDAAAAVTNVLPDAGGGVRKRYDPSSLSASLTLGPLHRTSSVGPGTAGQIIVRDHFPDPNPAFNGELIDGLTLNLTGIDDPNVQSSFQLTLRGPVDDLITNAGALPTFQDPRWAGLRTATFGLCRSSPDQANTCNLGGFTAQLLPVPEPASALLAAFGLAVVGAAARRRQG